MLAPMNDLVPFQPGVAAATLDDPTLEEARAALAPVIPQHAAFDGWNDTALSAAAAQIGLASAIARLAFADGPVVMIAAWFGAIDRQVAAAFPPARIAAMRVHERIEALVLARIESVAPDREALRRALAILALPTNAATAARLGWHAADEMWRLAGDTATDIAHYTKRATLGAVYAATILAFIDDESEDLADTRAFLKRRLRNVARIGRLKAQLLPSTERRFSPARLLGRLRYPTT